MKLRIFVFLLFMAPMAVFSQRLALSVEKDPFSEHEINSGIWNASLHSAIDEHTPCNISLSSKGLLRENLDGLTSLYLNIGDSVLFRGYTQGREIGVLADTAILVQKKPLMSGTHFDSDYKAHGLAFAEVQILETGSVSSKVLAHGRFIYSTDDTLTANLYYEKRIMKTILAPSDSLIGTDATVFTVEYLRWYNKEDKFPLAVQRRLNGKEWRLWLRDKDFGQSESIDETDIRKALLSSARITVSNGCVSVELGSAEDTVAEVYIVDLSGNTFGRTQKRLGETTTTFSISTVGLAKGTYMAVIILDNDPSLTEKRMLVL